VGAARARKSDDRAHAENGSAELRRGGSTWNSETPTDRRELEQLGLLVGFVGHEIRNLITPLSAYAQAALRSPGDLAMNHRALETAKDCAAQINAVTDSILSLARDVPRETDASAAVEPCVSGVLRLVSSRLGSSNITLRTAVEDGLAVGISETDLRHVLLNLVLNAIEAIENAGRGELSIHAGRANDGSVAIEISDDGPGMPREIMEWASSAELRDKALPIAGRGLGIALARMLIVREGGRLELLKGPRGGGLARVVLPDVD